MNDLKSSIHNRQSIELRIEELVLHGFAPRDRYSIADAVQLELARLLGEQGISPAVAHATELMTIDAGSFEAASGSSAERIGTHVAQSVYGGLRR